MARLNGSMAPSQAICITMDTFLLISLKAFLEFESVLKFNARYVQNMPGEENLIEVEAVSQLPK